MKKCLLFILFQIAFYTVFTQGILSGEMIFYAFGGSSAGINIGVITYTTDLRPTIVIDWGDGNIETIGGTVFPNDPPVTFYNEYYAQHIYSDTGTYEITYKDSFWVAGIKNIPFSENQPFLLKAKAWLNKEINFSQNHSVIFSTTSDYIQQMENGAFVHYPYPTDMDGDSILERLIPIPASGYFFPEATDSLACCLIWDRPLETGLYAFGLEYDDRREGKWRGTVQRFITINVDSTISESKERTPDIKIELYPNPATSTLLIETSLSTHSYEEVSIKATNLSGENLYQGEIMMINGKIFTEIDVFGWPPGLYFLIVEVDGQVWTEKVVIQ